MPHGIVVAVSVRELRYGPVCSLSMKASSIRNDPMHWRRRAEEARRLADQLDDPVVKKTLRDIAGSYEQLATLAETKHTPKTSK